MIILRAKVHIFVNIASKKPIIFAKWHNNFDFYYLFDSIRAQIKGARLTTYAPPDIKKLMDW